MMDHPTSPSPDGAAQRATEKKLALGSLSAHLGFWLVAGGTIWIDLWSKSHVFATLSSTETKTIIPKFIEFHCSLNDGAVFGSFTGQTGLFIVASLFALGFVFYLFAQSGKTQRGMHLALALILAGALGNLYDRAFVQADVVHFESQSGQRGTVIGKIVSGPNDPVLRVGDWPNGHHVRRFDLDRVEVHRQGVVRDFIKFIPKFPKWVPKYGGRDVWPWVFNVADSGLVCGVALLLMHTWWHRKEHEGGP